jgi:hypothetical protein
LVGGVLDDEAGGGEVAQPVVGDAGGQARAAVEEGPGPHRLGPVDELHDSSTVGDATWAVLQQHLDEGQHLDLLLLCGWYHAISFVANGAGVACEPGAPTFADVAP